MPKMVRYILDQESVQVGKEVRLPEESIIVEVKESRSQAGFYNIIYLVKLQ